MSAITLTQNPFSTNARSYAAFKKGASRPRTQLNVDASPPVPFCQSHGINPSIVPTIASQYFVLVVSTHGPVGPCAASIRANGGPCQYFKYPMSMLAVKWYADTVVSYE